MTTDFTHTRSTAAALGTLCPDVVSLADILDRQVRRQATAIAFTDDASSLTYAELDLTAGDLAARLVAAGVRPGELVGLEVDRSLDMLIGVLGIHKAGAAYVPLDPQHPADRLLYVMEDAGVRVLVTGSGEPTVTVSGVATLAVRTPHGGTLLPAPVIAKAGDRPAYVIYTSGSTGRPKGCVVTHANVLSLLRAALPLFDVTPEDRWALFHSGSFDVSVWEMWGALATGGTGVVVPVQAARSPAELLLLLIDQRITVLGQVPTVFRYLSEIHEQSGCPELKLRYLVFAGESIELDVVRGFLDRLAGPSPVIVNMYGPTETTVYATHKVIGEEDLRGTVPSPIGRVLPHLIGEIRDEQLRPVPDGESGELCIAGPGLIPGYLGLPDLTAERFVELDTATGRRRFYRTGDLARVLPDGELEYLGRNDQQVKLRGFRIELGEIESALRTHDLVRDVAVTVRETTGGAVLLVAWIVPVDPASQDLAGVLRRHARQYLPAYMAPDRYQTLPVLPLTGSGKLDRRSLSMREMSR